MNESMMQHAIVKEVYEVVCPHRIKSLDVGRVSPRCLSDGAAGAAPWQRASGRQRAGVHRDAVRPHIASHPIQFIFLEPARPQSIAAFETDVRVFRE